MDKKNTKTVDLNVQHAYSYYNAITGKASFNIQDYLAQQQNIETWFMTTSRHVHLTPGNGIIQLVTLIIHII